MKRILVLLAAVTLCAAAFAQPARRQLTTWNNHLEASAEADVYRVIFTGKIADGYHTYTLTDEFSATEFMDVAVSDCELVGAPYEISTPTEVIDEFGEKAKHYYNEIIIAQNVKVTGPNPVVSTKTRVCLRQTRFFYPIRRGRPFWSLCPVYHVFLLSAREIRILRYRS